LFPRYGQLSYLRKGKDISDHGPFIGLKSEENAEENQQGGNYGWHG
jgi:hypothetical protein